MGVILPQADEKRGKNVPAWRRRWANVYTPVHLFMYETADVANWRRDQGVKWQSLSTPAILPVSTRDNIDQIEADLIAETERGENKYLTMPHTVTNHGTYSSTQELLIELVCQRLLHDFQIVKSDAKSEKPVPTSSFSREWGSGGGGGGGGGSSTPRQPWVKPTTSASKFKIEAQLGGELQNEYLMSKGAYFHRLAATQDGSHSVSITRYVPTKLKYAAPEAYNYEVWHSREKQYSARIEHFSAQDYSSATGLKWDRLDACVAACSIDDLRSEEIYITKATAKRFSLVPRNPWEDQGKTSGQMTTEQEKEAAAGGLSRGVSSSSESLTRGISSASVGSDSSDRSSAAGGGPVSFRVWQDKVRL